MYTIIHLTQEILAAVVTKVPHTDILPPAPLPSFSLLPFPSFLFPPSFSLFLHFIFLLYLSIHLAEIFLESGRLVEAEVCYRDLIYRNPENYSYYESLEKCLKLGGCVCRVNISPNSLQVSCY